MEIMDHDDLDLNPWRQLCLGDEPIFCAAPSPANSDDIICPGSDDGLDDGAKITKRLRYEEQGLRFLRGEPIRILSASLRGPFDKASGWQNPWRSKTSASESLLTRPARIPTKPLPAIKQSLRKELEELRQQDGTPSTGDSVRCYLPSPDSQSDMPFSSSMETEKCVRIRAWATEVSSGLAERDEFWAPNEILNDQNSEPSRKRPAGKEWLKRKPSKRKRPDNSQSTAAASTPTPFPAAQTSMRNVSMPSSASQTKGSSRHTKSASRSFELTTPSSSTDQGPAGPAKEKAQPSKGRKAISQGELPKASRPASSGSVDSLPKQMSPKDGQTRQQVHADTQDQVSNDTVDRESRDGQEVEGDIGVESCQDNSFYYRTRPPLRQATPITTGQDVPTVITSAEPTQTKTPESSRQEDAVVETNLPEEQLQHQRISDQPKLTLKQHTSNESRAGSQTSNSQTETSSNTQDDDNIHSPAISTTKQSLSEDQQIESNGSHISDRDGSVSYATCEEATIPENRRSSIEPTDSMQVAAAALSILPTDTNPVEKNTGSIDLNIAQDHPVPQTMLEVKMDEKSVPIGQSTLVETYQADLQPAVGEGSTLIGDAMDVDEATLLETGDSTSNHVSSKDLSTTTIEAMSGAEPVIATTGISRHEMEEDSDTESAPVVVPLSQLDWGVAGANGSSPVEQRTVSEHNPTVPDIKVENMAENEDQTTQRTPPEPSQSVERQSPWVPDVLPAGELGIEHIKVEPVEYEPSLSPCPSHITVISSQASDRGTPKIRPSQQSPWAAESIAPTSANALELRSSVPTPAVTRRATVSSSAHQNLWDEMATYTTSSPNRVSSPAPLLGSKGPVFNSRLDQSTPVSGSEYRASEQSITESFTPPPPETRPSTPEPEVSIKSFAKFNTPSPRCQHPRPSNTRPSSTGQVRSILSSTKRSTPWGSTRSSRRVSFAPLPSEEESSPPTLSSPPTNATRAASPPPQLPVSTEDDDVGGGHFQNHFEAIKRRSENVRLRLQPRLLPSSSQQKPASPAIDAMAEAFREADAQMAAVPASHHDGPARAEDAILGTGVGIRDGEDTVMMDNGPQPQPQSPWQRQQSQSQGVDDVAAVLGNLDQFLDAWDVDAEMNKAGLEASGGHGSGREEKDNGGRLEAPFAWA
ncbi:hypothetical protein F5B20DRAFT_555632 [Whalleya microplaca]|nr:hypothetical protein F5B20DRAFT_555632 [Whalleya microplaca]